MRTSLSSKNIASTHAASMNPDVDDVVAPGGGGGFITCVSCTIKNLKPDCDIIGKPEFVASCVSELDAGEPAHFYIAPKLGTKKRCCISLDAYFLCPNCDLWCS